jgi:hypothetical protein
VLGADEELVYVPDAVPGREEDGDLEAASEAELNARVELECIPMLVPGRAGEL